MLVLDRKRVLLVRPPSRCGWGYMWAPLALNLEYVAAAIEDLCEIEILNQEFNKTPVEKLLKDFRPDIFGVTMSATDHKNGLDLCKTAKKYDCQTIVGGYHPTAIPDELLTFDQIDIVARGEAEVTAREFMQKGTPEGVNGLSYRKDGKVIHNPARECVANLDDLKFPARHFRVGDECHMWTKKGERHRDQVHTSRGCWGKCTFCCEPSMSNSRQRFRSVENIMKEVKEVYELHHKEPTICIWGDPHFMGKPAMVDKLCDRLIEEDMDMIFTAMLRSDTVARHPDIVKKMVKAGIIGYCMGIETPYEGDLGATKKEISNDIQMKAVRTLRENNAVAGGTFVIGLPGQTKEEILTFPEFARHLGMTNAAFAIATPQAGTEFYRDLDSKGLIVDHDWTKYDQMHLVFKHDKLTGRELEELLTGCIGRFYALDILLDDMVCYMYREQGGRKMTIREAVDHFMDRFDFIMDAGGDYQPEESMHFSKIFLTSQIQPYTRQRTEHIGMHNVIDLRKMLSVLGDQKLQVILKHEGKVFAYYVIKTDKTKVHWLDITDKYNDDATLNIEIHLEDMALLRHKPSAFGTMMAKRIIKGCKFSSLFRTVLAAFAVFLEYKDWKRVNKDKPKGWGGRANVGGAKGEPMTLPKDFFENFAAADGWDPKKYAEIRKRNAGQ